MFHPTYGHVAHIYYHFRGGYYVRFKRQGTYYYSPYYQTFEEALAARNFYQRLVPKGVPKGKYDRKGKRVRKSVVHLDKWVI